ncbi:MAG: hypothetical protein U0736_01905 [Gemmataceae bacterium]
MTMFPISVRRRDFLDPLAQIDVPARAGVRHIELRSIHQTNVLDLSDAQLADFLARALLDARGFRLAAVGSPIGKVKIDSDFGPHLQALSPRPGGARFDTPNMRIFSYYPLGEHHD